MNLPIKCIQNNPKNTPLFYGDYSLQQQTLYLGPQGLTDHNPRVRDLHDSKAYHRKEGIQALRFTLNLFNPELSKAFFEMLLSSQNQTVQFGPRTGRDRPRFVRKYYLRKSRDKYRPVHAVELNFLSPTNFSMMGNDFELRFPLPEYVFGNLYNQWNHLFKDTSLEIDLGFYDWIKANVCVDLSIHSIRVVHLSRLFPLVNRLSDHPIAFLFLR